MFTIRPPKTNGNGHNGNGHKNGNGNGNGHNGNGHKPETVLGPGGYYDAALTKLMEIVNAAWTNLE